MPQPNAWWLGAFQGRELKKFCNIIFVIKYFYKLVSIILFCHQCEKVFFSAFDPFWCETIYLSGQLKMSWKTMLLQMVCVQGQKYSCKLCGKDYSALMGLNIYKRNVHGIITWIKIPQILKNSSDVRDIKKRNHEFKVLHKGQRAFKNPFPMVYYFLLINLKNILSLAFFVLKDSFFLILYSEYDKWIFN